MWSLSEQERNENPRFAAWADATGMPQGMLSSLLDFQPVLEVRAVHLSRLADAAEASGKTDRAKALRVLAAEIRAEAMRLDEMIGSFDGCSQFED